MTALYRTFTMALTDSAGRTSRSRKTPFPRSSRSSQTSLVRRSSPMTLYRNVASLRCDRRAMLQRSPPLFLPPLLSNVLRRRANAMKRSLPSLFHPHAIHGPLIKVKTAWLPWAVACRSHGALHQTIRSHEAKGRASAMTIHGPLIRVRKTWLP